MEEFFIIISYEMVFDMMGEVVNTLEVEYC